MVQQFGDCWKLSLYYNMDVSSVNLDQESLMRKLSQAYYESLVRMSL